MDGLKGWTLRHDPNEWPHLDVKAHVVYFRAVEAGEREPLSGEPFPWSVTAEMSLCHELAHIHLKHDKLPQLDVLLGFRQPEPEVWAYVWARGMPHPTIRRDSAPCPCSIDLVQDFLSPTEFKLAHRWVGSCKHG